MEPEQTRKEILYREAGKFCLDVSKLVFGGVILAGVMKLDINLKALIIVGIIVVLLFVAAGFACILMSTPKKKE